MIALRKKIANGLKQKRFFHTFIVGDEEVAQYAKGRGHYFSFTLLKLDTTVHYIVLDTQVEAYHLRQGTYEHKRLLYLIELLETGEWKVGEKSKMMNLYTDTPYKKCKSAA